MSSKSRMDRVDGFMVKFIVWGVCHPYSESVASQGVASLGREGKDALELIEK